MQTYESEENNSENVHSVSHNLQNNLFVSKVTNNGNLSENWTTELLIENKLKIKIKVDCGADVSIINLEQFNRLGKARPKLEKSNVTYKAYNGTNIAIHGKCVMQVETTEGKYHALEFVVAQYDSILSGDHSVELGFIKKLFNVNADNINPAVFDEIGCLEDEIKLYSMYLHVPP
jgi:hypothetical protein